MGLANMKTAIICVLVVGLTFVAAADNSASYAAGSCDLREAEGQCIEYNSAYTVDDVQRRCNEIDGTYIDGPCPEDKTFVGSCTIPIESDSDSPTGSSGGGACFSFSISLPGDPGAGDNRIDDTRCYSSQSECEAARAEAMSVWAQEGHIVHSVGQCL